MVSVRPVHPAELPGILAVTGQTAWDQLSPRERAVSAPATIAQGAANMTLGTLQGGGALLVAEADGVLAGYVLAKLVPNVLTGLLESQWLDIFVDRAFRQRGIGQLLMDAAAEWSVQSGARHAALAISAHNVASTRNALKGGFAPERTIFGRLLTAPKAPVATANSPAL